MGGIRRRLARHALGGARLLHHQKLTRAALGVAAATIAVAIALAALSPPSQGASTRTQAADLTLPASVRCFRNAVNKAALAPLLNCFAPRGVVIDVSRRFAGRAAIRTWASNEFIGGRLTIIRRVARPRNPDGLTLLVRFAPGGADGFLAHYRFVSRNGKLVLVDMQYPG
jgi:hypothetical protein